jgi:hypothetical protein
LRARWFTGTIVTPMVIKGLIGRAPMGKLYLTKEGRAAFSSAVRLCSGEVSSSAAGGHGAPWFVRARVRR